MKTNIEGILDKSKTWCASHMNTLRMAIPALRESFIVFEWGVLLFPLLVVLLATALFPFGGHVALWQAPTALALTVGIMLLQRRYALKRRLVALALFSLFLIFIWCIVGCLLMSGWDNMAYHYPKVFLLMKGWNPFLTNTEETLLSFSGLPKQAFRPLHTLFLPHTVHVFNAAIGFFMQAPHAPNFGLSPFLMLSGGGVMANVTCARLVEFHTCGNRNTRVGRRLHRV